ncbi:MAG: RpiB/LacA/LacB family sugar-phosphate isomerase [Phycisphaeraceae bacterium]|nr:RpiB/LacA/LacB family sugar-phosphate isomerase [Phycisphaeraceae bacterium]
MKIAMGADHRGADALLRIERRLLVQGYEAVVWRSTGAGPSDDYPDVAYPVAKAVARGEAQRGLLVCGSGIGMCIAANKVHGVRAALVHDEVGADMSRRHSDANVLCLPADLIGQRLIERIIQIWLTTEFEGGRHSRRVHKIQAIEQGQDPRLLNDAAPSPPLSEPRVTVLADAASTPARGVSRG